MTKIVEVAAAVLMRGPDRAPHFGAAEFLLAQRPPGKVYAGYWEFPGGKVEPGENACQALVRELHEELGIVVDEAWPWLTREFTYPHATVRLKFFRVPTWHGEIAPLEHSGFAWQRAGAPSTVAPVLPANDPILKALALPALLAITNAEENGTAAELARLDAALDNGLKLIQVRDKTLRRAQREDFAAAVVVRARGHHAHVLINDDADLALRLGADGVHLSAASLMAASERPRLPWVGASCHGANELEHAAALGLDFALLGPILPTPTHPDTAAIGWDEFSRLVERCPLPVYGLGGLRPESLAAARAHGAHGIAMLRGW